MDPNELVRHARARFDHEAARRVLKEKYLARMLFAHSGGMWRAGPELITVLRACADDTAVILDIYQTPIEINVQDLLTSCQQRWQEQMTAWLLEHQQLAQQR